MEELVEEQVLDVDKREVKENIE